MRRVLAGMESHLKLIGVKPMEENILVPLRNSEEVYGITQYLETIAKPDARVIFVVRCSTGSCHQALDRTFRLEPGLPSSVVGSESSVQWSLEHKKRLAENAILSACATLRKRGVNIKVNAHSGSTKRVAKNYLLHSDTNFLVVRPKQGVYICSFKGYRGAEDSLGDPWPYCFSMVGRKRKAAVLSAGSN